MDPPAADAVISTTTDCVICVSPDGVISCRDLTALVQALPARVCRAEAERTPDHTKLPSSSPADELLVAQYLTTAVQGADQRTGEDAQQGEGEAEAEHHRDHAG